MCCALAAQRTAWRWARRCCSSTASWPQTLTTAANRPGNWRRRCAFWLRRGWGLLESGAWLRNATHANSCAQYFAAQMNGIPGIQLAGPVEANAVFLQAPDEILAALRERGWRFYTFIGGAARFMFAWDADLARVDELCSDLRECAVGVPADAVGAKRSRGN